jgi:hypothetical protein
MIESRMKMKCSVDDFIEEFEKFMPKMSTQKAAYEAAERRHQDLTGQRRYSDFESFRSSRVRRLKKKVRAR